MIPSMHLCKIRKIYMLCIPQQLHIDKNMTQKHNGKQKNERQNSEVRLFSFKKIDWIGEEYMGHFRILMFFSTQDVVHNVMYIAVLFTPYEYFKHFSHLKLFNKTSFKKR